MYQQSINYSRKRLRTDNSERSFNEQFLTKDKCYNEFECSLCKQFYENVNF
jgi:hypothetical protein